MANPKPGEIRPDRGDGVPGAAWPDAATAAALAARFGLEFRETIDPREVDPVLVATVPIQYARRAARGLLPVATTGAGPVELAATVFACLVL